MEKKKEKPVKEVMSEMNSLFNKFMEDAEQFRKKLAEHNNNQPSI